MPPTVFIKRELAHRIGTLTDVDSIIVVHDHAIKQIGTHYELMRTCETRRQAWLVQTRSLMPNMKVEIDENGIPSITPISQ